MAASKKSNRSISQVDEIVELPSTSGAAALEKRSNPFNRDTKPLKRHSRSMSVINFFEQEKLEEVPSELATPKTLSKNQEKKSNKKKETYKFYVGLDEFEDSNSMPGASAAEDINQQFVEANNEYAQLELRASREEQCLSNNTATLKLQQRSKSMPEVSCLKDVTLEKIRKKETYKFYIDLHEYNVVPSNEEGKLSQVMQPGHEVTKNSQIDTEEAEQSHGTTEMRHRPDSPIYDTVPAAYAPPLGNDDVKSTPSELRMRREEVSEKVSQLVEQRNPTVHMLHGFDNPIYDSVIIKVPVAYAQPLSNDDVNGTPSEPQMRRQEQQAGAHCEQGVVLGSSQRNSTESAFSLESIQKHYHDRYGDLDNDNSDSPSENSHHSVSPTKEDKTSSDSTANTNAKADVRVETVAVNEDVKNEGTIKQRSYPAVATKPVLKGLPKKKQERSAVHIKFGVISAPRLEPIPGPGWVLQQIGNFNK